MKSTPARGLCRLALLGFVAAAAAPARGDGPDTLETLGFPEGDFAHCARYALESAMHVQYDAALVDRITVEQCFARGRAEGLDERAMREIMAQALATFIRPPRYADYDPRTFAPDQ